jgi:uncharacterized Zn finger protein
MKQILIFALILTGLMSCNKETIEDDSIVLKSDKCGMVTRKVTITMPDTTTYYITVSNHNSNNHKNFYLPLEQWDEIVRYDEFCTDQSW